MKISMDGTYDNQIIDSVRMKFAKDMYSIFAEDINNRERGIVVEPETEGVDFYFLLGFKTQEMLNEFPIIEQEFMKHCGNRLEELNALDWYDEAYPGINNPINIMTSNVLRLIYNGAKTGDEYCKNLILRLYKTYHKKEYEQVKRYKILTPNKILNISSDFNIEDQDFLIARVLCMSQFLESVSLGDKCSVLYKVFVKKKEAFIDLVEMAIKGIELKPETIEEAIPIVDSWWQEADKKSALTLKYANLKEFTNIIFRYQGFSDDYQIRCINDYRGGKVHMTITLAMLMNAYPGKKFSFEEVQEYSFIRDLVLALTNSVAVIAEKTDFLLGERISEEYLEKARFKRKPSDSIYQNKKAAPKGLVNTAVISSGEAKKEDYLREIEDLRAKNNRLKQEVSSLRNDNRTLNREIGELKATCNNYETEHQELVKLRDYAYRSTKEDVEQVKEESVSDYEELIADKRILIIGGHRNWHNKVKERFPKWVCVDSEKNSAHNPCMTEEYDKVYLYTKHIGHPEYWKFVNYMNKKGISYGYIGNINMNSVIINVGKDIKDN